MLAAQAQKEFTVNEAFALIDALLHAVVEGVANDPPAAPADGECWILDSQPTGNWSGQAGQIACRQAGNWLFITPVEGMVVFDKSAMQTTRFNGTWVSAGTVSSPTGGNTIDAQARLAIADILSALEAARIIPSP